jgi:hypothetical protein
MLLEHSFFFVLIIEFKLFKHLTDILVDIAGINRK